MKVLMLATAAGPNGVWRAGSVQDLPKEQAAVLARFGYAEVVDPPAVSAPVEVAAVDPVVETADSPKQAPKRRRRAVKKE